jgi:hypothetical protein
MTLILGMTKPEGIYLSVDYRVSNVKTRVLIDDTSVKHLTVHYAPEDGPKALMAYTGVAQLPDGMPVGDWLKETVRGHDEVFDVSVQHLKGRLDRDLSRYLYRHQAPLIVVILAIHGNECFLGDFHNIELVGGFDSTQQKLSVAKKFGYEMTKLAEPSWWAFGGGRKHVKTGGHSSKLDHALKVRPRQPQNHMKLLAAVNRQVAKVDNTVSPHCHVSFIPASDYFSTENQRPGWGPASQVFVEHGESVPFTMPMIVHGIDLSFQMEHFQRGAQEMFKLLKEGKDPGPNPLGLLSPDEINKHLKRRQ